MNLAALIVAVGLIVLVLGLLNILTAPAVTVGVVLLIVGVVLYFVVPNIRR